MKKTIRSKANALAGAWMTLSEWADWYATPCNFPAPLPLAAPLAVNDLCILRSPSPS
ncbi:MAG: hypothetical protein AAFX78_10260 [Cyanobacteria bacterium J06638_20]